MFINFFKLFEEILIFDNGFIDVNSNANFKRQTQNK